MDGRAAILHASAGWLYYFLEKTRFRTMFKSYGLFVTIIVAVVMFVEPVRNLLNNFFLKDNEQLREEKIIGPVSGYNPRVEDIQKTLKGSHFEPGPVDGVMGIQTRKAIREFQKERGLRSIGKVDSKTWLEFNREKEKLKEEEASQPLDLSSEKHSSDIKSEEEIAKIMGPQEKTIKEKLSKDKKKRIQIALQKAGFYKGKIDGKIGPQTKRAIKDFQKAKGLKTDGVVGVQVWVELNKYLNE